MALEVAGNCLHWQQQPAISRTQSFPSLIHYRNLTRRQSLQSSFAQRRKKNQIFTIASSSSSSGGYSNDVNGNWEEEFVKRKRIQDLVFKVNNNNNNIDACRAHEEEEENTSISETTFFTSEPPWSERPEWMELDGIVPASVERKANSVDLPLSLRIIKRKKRRWEENFFIDAGDSACCSVKKAFSSMVFIVRELQSYTIQMREALLYENLEGILARVKGEMNASFVWLFQQIFSSTPTLMVYVMLLLANFTVHSIGHNSAALAAMAPSPTQHSDLLLIERDDGHLNQHLQAISLKIFDSSSVGRTASVGGIGGGGGNTKPVAGDTDEPNGGGVVVPEEEVAAAWNRLVEEATRMQATARDEALMDHETVNCFVSPVRVEVEPEDSEEYSKTEMMYHQSLALDPDNTLLLSNFAQFLYLVLHDHDRAEYYFKRAAGIKPADAESLSRYASFLWLVRKDLGAAEETYLEAIAAEPSNTYYAANYAHFLWNTGGEDTCYPLDGDNAC